MPFFQRYWRSFPQSVRVSIAAGCCLLLVLGVCIASVSRHREPKRQALPVAAAPDKLGDRQSAPDAKTAHLIAAKFNHPVLIESATTETTEVSALANGASELTSHTVPQRVFQGRNWTPIDLALAKDTDGFLAPKASALPVQFSAGGGGPLAKLRTKAGAVVTIGAPVKTLPLPTVSKNAATYTEILPGVDLRMVATETGMSEVLIVNTAAAAKNPALSALSFAFGGATVTPVAGGVAYIGTGPDALVSPSAYWWDSRSAGADETGPNNNADPVPFGRTIANGSEILDVASLAATPGMQFPLYVDPAVTLGVPGWTYVMTAWPTTSNWGGTSDSPGMGKVGFIDAAHANPDPNILARSLFNADIPRSLWDAHIYSAAWNGVTTWSSTCSATPVEAWLVTGNIDASTTWNNQPPINTWLDSQNVSGPNNSSCPNNVPVGFNVTTALAWAAASHQGRITLELKAPASWEANWTSWKKFYGMYVTVTYNSIPTNTLGKFVQPLAAGCQPSSSPAIVNSSASSIVLTSTVGDADGGPIADRFWVTTTSGVNVLPTSVAPAGYIDTGLIAPGIINVTIPQGTLSGGQTLLWWSQATDGSDTSPATPYCYFTVDNAGPAAPAVALAPGQAVPKNVGENARVRMSGNLNNMLINGGFEDGTSNWGLYGPATFEVVPPISPLPPSPPVAPAPVEGLKYAVVGATGISGDIYQSVPVNLAAGSTVCVTAKVTTAAGTSGSTGASGVLAVFGNSDPNQTAQTSFTNLPIDGSWTLVQACVDSTVALSSVLVQLFPTVGGPKIAMDTVVMNVDLLLNGGFNAGSSSWQYGPAGTNFSTYTAAAGAGTPFDGARLAATNTTSGVGSFNQSVSRLMTPGSTYCVSAAVATQSGATGAAGRLAIFARGNAGGAPDLIGFWDFGGLPGNSQWQTEQACLTITGSNNYSTLAVGVYPLTNAPTLIVDSVNVNASTGRLVYWLVPANTAVTAAPVTAGNAPACGATTNSPGYTVWAECAGADGATTVTVSPIGSPATTLWVAALAPTGLISKPTPLRLTNLRDDPATSLATAHRWLPDTLVSPGATFPDSATLGASAQPLTLQGGANWTSSVVLPGTTSNVLQLNGTGGFANAPTGTTAVDTAHSFTVSAWAKPSSTLSPVGTHVIASQGGAPNAGFTLQLSNDQWQFCMRPPDPASPAPPATPTCVTSAVFVNLSTPAWTMLTGTWDEINQRLSLYVNAGLPQIAGRAVDPGTPSAIGRFTLGAVNNNGTNGSYWKGLIDDVWAMPGVVNINQVATLGQQPRLPELTSW